MEKECKKSVILSNVRRASGQVQGIEKMIDENRDIADVLQQVNASTSALRSIAKQLLQDYSDGCFTKSNKMNKNDLAKLIDQLFKNM